MPIYGESLDGVPRAVFVHIPKTGGRYIDRQFCINYVDQSVRNWDLHGMRQHYSITELMLTDDSLGNVHKFAVVRSPVSKLISTYFFRGNCERLYPSFDLYLDFLEEVMSHQLYLDPAYVDKFYVDHRIDINHLRPQRDFVDGAKDIDIFKIEFDLNRLKQKIRGTYQVDLADLCVPDNYLSKVAKRHRERIEELYQEDFEYLGYNREQNIITESKPMISADNPPKERRLAILVIAASNQKVYVHYIHTYWTSVIEYTIKHKPNIDVFLLFERGKDVTPYQHLKDHIIMDENQDFNGYFEPERGGRAVPGVLSKTVFALELLQDKYDVILRTNLSSMFHLPRLEQLIQEKERVIYSGGAVWTDALRSDLQFRNRIGEDKSIKSLDELKDYPGNTFISGAGFLLGREDVRRLIENKKKLRYDIIDDVSIGLMMPEHESLRHFTLKLVPTESISSMMEKLNTANYIHVRLQHFPVEIAESLWERIESCEIWSLSEEEE